MPRTDAGQATVEWSALVLLVALALAGLGYAATRAGAWRLGDAILHAIVCAAGDGCPHALEDAYGKELAKTVREYAPNIVYERRSAELPVDFRRCREVACSNGSDRAAEITESAAGLPVTAFTRVVDRRPQGRDLYLQYWLYFPESFSGGIGRSLGPLADRWPGYHPDDWELSSHRFHPWTPDAPCFTAPGESFAPSASGWLGTSDPFPSCIECGAILTAFAARDADN